jgi:hypothetical protein
MRIQKKKLACQEATSVPFQPDDYLFFFFKPSIITTEKPTVQPGDAFETPAFKPRFDENQILRHIQESLLDTYL